MKRWSAVVVLLWSLAAPDASMGAPAPAPEAPLKAPTGVPGMQAQRIEEPVFGGHAMIYEAGKEHARSVLLVHGMGEAGANDFSEVVPWLARTHHVVAVDLPGFGQSDKANALYSPRNYATFLKHVADRFISGRFTIVAHSMGAVISLRFAAMYPDALERLVVVDAPGVLHRYAYTSHHLSQFGTGFLPANVDPIERVGRLMRKLMGTAENWNVDPTLVLKTETSRQRYLGGDPTRIAGLAMASEDLSRDVDRIRMETLIVWGRKDTVAPLRTGQMLESVLPNARLIVIDDAAHEPMNQTPALFRAAVEPFIERGLEGVPAPPVRTMEKWPGARCEKKKQIVYEGEYERLDIVKCDNILIRNARVHFLDVRDSSVTIEDSHIGGGEIGMSLRDSRVQMNGGRVEGDVAIMANDGKLDLAGVTVDAKSAAVKTPDDTTEVVFSICRVHGPIMNGTIHGVYRAEKNRPL